LAVFGPLAGSMLHRFATSDAAAPTGTVFESFSVFVTTIGVDPAAVAGTTMTRLPAPFWTVCTAVYLAIACALIVRTLHDLAAARRLARADVPVDDVRRARLDAAIRLAGVPRDRVRVCDENVIPSLVGTTRPRIVLPSRLLDALDADELAAVLLHEEMHRRNRDAALSVAQRVASALVFFFPLLGPMQRRLREAAELRCDEDAINAGADPSAYVRALAGTIRLGLEPSPAPAALGDGNLSLIGKRLARLAEPRRSETMIKHRVAIVAAAIVLVAGVVFPVTPAKRLAGLGPPIAELDGLWNGSLPVSLAFEKTPAAKVLEAIAKAGTINVTVVGRQDCCPVTVVLADVPLRQALEAVAAQIDLHYEVVDNHSLRVTLPSPRVPTADIVMPELLTKVEPVYPKDAREARIGGKVILQAVIREDGTVGDVQVLSNDSGLPSLAESAATAVSQRVYRPATKDGKPVSIYFTIRVDFRLGTDDDKDVIE
jgi:TonB family protein